MAYNVDIDTTAPGKYLADIDYIWNMIYDKVNKGDSLDDYVNELRNDSEIEEVSLDDNEVYVLHKEGFETTFTISKQS